MGSHFANRRVRSFFPNAQQKGSHFEGWGSWAEAVRREISALSSRSVGKRTQASASVAPGWTPRRSPSSIAVVDFGPWCPCGLSKASVVRRMRLLGLAILVTVAFGPSGRRRRSRVSTVSQQGLGGVLVAKRKSHLQTLSSWGVKSVNSDRDWGVLVARHIQEVGVLGKGRQRC